MSELRRRSFFALPLLVLGLPAAAAEAPSPQATVTEFYQWYMHAVKADRYPLRDDQPTLRKYVAAALIARLKKADASDDPPDADYFIQAQDWGDDWETNIAVTDALIERGTATLVVVLGAGAGSEHRRLRVGLVQAGGAWKIQSVTPLPD